MDIKLTNQMMIFGMMEIWILQEATDHPLIFKRKEKGTLHGSGDDR